jgi:hypothetical protein
MRTPCDDLDVGGRTEDASEESFIDSDEGLAGYELEAALLSRLDMCNAVDKRVPVETGWEDRVSRRR